jgi:hypothetical protein
VFIGILAILGAIGLSIVSAYFSITGIATIFSGAVIGVTLMAAMLEFAKLVSTVWLYAWWKKTSLLLKYYLTAAVTILILISSIGIYGYLARAYVGQRNPGQEIENRILRIDQSISREERVIESSQAALDQLDAALDRLIELDYIGYGLNQRNEQQAEREQLNQQILDAEENISDLLDQKFEFQNQLDDFSVDVGPIQYIAILLYGEDDAETYFDNAVRVFILLLVAVFDPFAVLLMVAGNIAIDNRRKKRRKPQRRKRKSVKAVASKNEVEDEPESEPEPEPEPEPQPAPKKIEIDMSNFVDPAEIRKAKAVTTHKNPLLIFSFLVVVYVVSFVYCRLQCYLQASKEQQMG